MFIAIIFIAELIIALNLISWIVKVDRKVCKYNQCVVVLKPLVQTALQYVRCLVNNFNRSFEKVYTFIKKKKEQVIFKTVVMIAIYIVLIVFKIRTKKVAKIYKLLSVMRDLTLELAI